MSPSTPFAFQSDQASGLNATAMRPAVQSASRMS